jgi:hypothetical protein
MPKSEGGYLDEGLSNHNEDESNSLSARGGVTIGILETT